jgi:Domain of unknown function (DUF4166)
MTSIYQRALGADFARLHPKMQWRFGFGADDEVCQIGTGVMDEVWHGRVFTVPFLKFGSTRRLLFAERGSDVPFTISNYAYLDSFGRETVTWSRRYQFPGATSSFDATMVYSTERDTIIDYLGTHQHLAVDIDCRVDEAGAMCLRSGAQRFYEGWAGFRFPMVFTGVADVREWWDEPNEVFRISVRVSNRVFGPLFGYRGRFTVAESRCTRAQIPHDVLPLREERRE